MYDIDVIIPTYRPDSLFLESLERLSKQSVKPENIYIINTDRSIWDALDMDSKIDNLSLDINIDVSHIEKKGLRSRCKQESGCIKILCKIFRMHDSGCIA